VVPLAVIARQSFLSFSLSFLLSLQKAGLFTIDLAFAPFIQLRLLKEKREKKIDNSPPAYCFSLP